MQNPASLQPATLNGSRLKFVVDNIPDTEIRPSATHGNGLFATRNFEAGEIIATLDGQVVNWPSYEQIKSMLPYGDHNNDLFMEWNALSADTLLIRPFRTKYSFINHGRTPNIKRIDGPLRLITTTAIAAQTELLIDYRDEPLSPEYLQQATFL